MTDQTLPLIASSIQASKPSLVYGAMATLPVANAQGIILIRPPLDKVPAAATVTSAVVVFTTANASTGSSTVSIQPLTSAYTSSVTWTTKPTTTTSLDSETHANPTPGTLWSWDVTAWAQSVVSGTTTNYGLQIYTTGSNPATFAGTKAASGYPVLQLTYSLLPDTPSNLHPSSGAVNTSTPSLTFDGDDDMISLQIQIDTPPGGLSGAAYDTGEVPATAGLFSLVGTGHGLSDGDVRVWRARQKNSSGWSPWSSWVNISRAAKATLSITSPGASSISDGTPTVQWSFGGTQVAWRVTLKDSTTGKMLSDSGKQLGTATSWTVPKGLNTDGQSGIIQVYVWDNVDRAATPGDPIYTSASLTVTLNLDAGVTPMDSVDVSQSPPLPAVRISGIRTEGVPDQVALFRNGVQIGRWTGSSVFTGTHFAVWDHTAPMNVPATYRVAPITITGGVAHVAKGGIAETYTPHCQGIWLVDESDPTQRAALWGADEQEQSSPETSVLHTPISSDGDIEVIRRRLIRLPRQGTIAATLTDAVETYAADSEAALLNFIDNDAGHLYRLVLGRQNLRVIVGDIDLSELSNDTTGTRKVGVTFNWYSRADQSVTVS